MHLKTDNPHQDDGGHPAGVNQSNIEGISNFNIAENPKFLKQKVQRRFGLSPAYACLIVELCFCGGLPR